MQIELFKETKTVNPRKVIMGVYKYKGDDPKTADEMCVCLGRDTIWFGRNIPEGSIYGTSEICTNFNDLEYVAELTFGVCKYLNKKDYNGKLIDYPHWYFKDNKNNQIVMYGKALLPDNMLNECKKLTKQISGF